MNNIKGTVSRKVSGQSYFVMVVPDNNLNGDNNMLAIYAQETEDGAEAIGCEIEVIDFRLQIQMENDDFEEIDFNDLTLLGFCYTEEFYPEDWSDEAEDAIAAIDSEYEDEIVWTCVDCNEYDECEGCNPEF